MEDKLIRDALGSPVPQYFNLDLQTFAVSTIDGAVATGVDFSKTKLIRDKLGAPIPQAWDSTNNKWVAVTTNSSSGGGISSWNDLTDKPTEYPSSIPNVSGLNDALNKKANSGDLTSLDNKFTEQLAENVNGINEKTYTYSYLPDGTVQTITEKDAFDNIISTTTFSYKTNGDVDTSTKILMERRL